MDISSLIKKLDISKIKMFFLAIFDREALLDYLYEKANSAINMLLEANAAEVTAIREKLYRISCYCRKYFEYVPAPWQKYADAINELLYKIWFATDDNELVAEETKAIIKEAQIAYSVWMAD